MLNSSTRDDSFQTLVYTFLLVICCIYLFRLSNKWRNPPKEPILSDGVVTQDRAPAHTSNIETLIDDVLCQIYSPRGHISSLALLADGKHVVCACKAEETIQVWNMDDHGEKEPLMNLGVAVNVIASSKDGKLVVTGDVGGKVMIWDTSLQKKSQSEERHGKMITALDISPYSSPVASGSNDGAVAIWHMEQLGSPLAPGPLMHHGESMSVSSVKFSPAGNRIASACAHWDCNVKIWHSRTGDQLASIRVDGSPTHSLAWSSDGQRLFAGCYNGSICYFNTITRKPFSKVVEPRPGDDSITSLCVSESDQFLVSFSAPGRTVDIWDIRDTLAHKPLRSYSRCVSASVSQDSLYLASSGDDTKISIRNVSEVVEESYFFHRLAPSPNHLLTYISPPAYRAWKCGDLEEVEHILSREIDNKCFQWSACYAHANRALVRIRRQNLNGALDDVDVIMTNGGQIPQIAHIAKAMALIGQGKRTEAIDAFESVHHADAKEFVECVKSVILFEEELLDKVKRGMGLVGLPSPGDVSSCPWVKTRKLLLLAEHLLQRGEYNEGLRLLAKAPDLGMSLHVPEAKIIPLVFGWDIYDLECMAQQLICQALFASGRTREVKDFLYMNENCLDEELEVKKANLGWLNEKLGDEAMLRGKYDDAITWYSVALDLCPGSRVVDCGSEFAKKCLSTVEVVSDGPDGTISQDLALMSRYPPGSARLFSKRSKAKAFKELWHDALEDADKAINMDQLCPWGYERRYTALHALRRYQEATEALDKMVRKLEESADLSVRELRKNYIAPSETIATIDKQITETFDNSPLVLINVKTGRLCNATERIRIFKEDPIFYELVSSMSIRLDRERIKKAVARYFRYVMFSHTWEGKEPTFQDVSGNTIYELDSSPLNEKLRRFCETVKDDPEGYLWAWSDTCCIDKTIETVYRKSIRSMYIWYKRSALTLVLLARGSTPITLKNNRWMTRAWTLQELLSPKTIRFYDRDWKLYRDDNLPNHKESPDIKRELAEAIDVAEHTLVDFSPELLSIRAKLRLASTREATQKEDIAYALIGIFSSDLIPEYRDAEVGLGLLLQEIADREGDIKPVLDWVGKSSQFNSCLPAQISVYSQPPYNLPSIPEDEVEKRVAELQTALPRKDATTLYETLSHLDPPHFANRRLRLPCIIFPVTVLKVGVENSVEALGRRTSYQLKSALGNVCFTTTGTLPPGRTILVYPWVRYLLDRTHEYAKSIDHTVASPVAYLNVASQSPTTDLRLLTHLEQPFRGLLLVNQSAHEYKRIAADAEIVVPGGKLTSLEGIHAKVLGIL